MGAAAAVWLGLNKRRFCLVFCGRPEFASRVGDEIIEIQGGKGLCLCLKDTKAGFVNV